jgi:magnesium-transporting ATPase (P-type)
MFFLTLVSFFIRFAIQRIGENNFNHTKNWTDMLYFVIISVSLLFIGIPKGLLLSLNYTLDYSMKRMYDNSILI